MTKVVDFLASLKLTIFNFAALMILVFIATLRQTDVGIYYIKKEMFEPFGFPIGVLIFVNLIFAAYKKFKWKASHTGIWIMHIGVLVLVVGSGWISVATVESQMAVEEGKSSNYSESLTLAELAVVMPFDGTKDKVISIPGYQLKKGGTISHPELPFDIHIRDYFPNSAMTLKPAASEALADKFDVRRIPITKRNNSRNMPAAFVEVAGQPLLLSTWLTAKQSVRHDADTYHLFLRPKRYYNDYRIHLEDFRHDVYPGTQIPKNFASTVRVNDGEKAVISMNNPLRYQGKTYYQASFAKNDTISIFQVVENSGWWLPYASCFLITLGMMIHFGMKLSRFLRKTWA